VQGYELVMLNGVAVALYGETEFLQARCAKPGQWPGFAAGAVKPKSSSAADA